MRKTESRGIIRDSKFILANNKFTCNKNNKGLTELGTLASVEVQNPELGLTMLKVMN